MIRSRFDELGEYLKGRLSSLCLRCEQLTMDIDKLTVDEGGHEESVNGVHLCSFAYSGIIYVERLRRDLLGKFLIFVRGWLDEYDDTRGRFHLPAPAVNLITLDNSYCDAMITIEFVDPVYLAEGDGPDAIDWDGRKFSLKDFEYRVAERGTVEGGGTDV